MQDSTALPDLRILPTDALVPHEEVDPRRVDRLCQRMKEEGKLKNPPIVAAIPGSDRYVILDGASRSMALRTMHFPHTVAQLVSYGDPGILLDTWYHVVAGMDLEAFEQGLDDVEDLELCPSGLEEARAALATNQAAAYIVCKNGVRIVTKPNRRVIHDIHLLNEIVRSYKGRAEIYRASNDIWEKQAPFYPAMTALVIFPRYSPADILEVARNGEKVPTGVTRHIIPQRALHINFPLWVLAADWKIEAKLEWLQQWWMDRMADNSVRFYSESTFLFDE